MLVREEALEGGHTNSGAVVRVGNTIRRPRNDGSRAVEALLLHLERVGFDAAPRFRGYDDLGRQVLEYVEGDVSPSPSWQLDDERNAHELGRIAKMLRLLHHATASFAPPEDANPLRQLPLPGSTWTHGDPGYGNVVYCDGRPIALIDWEFAAPADPVCDPAGLLAMCIRGPRPDADDAPRRAKAAVAAARSIATGYGMDHEQARRLPFAAATVLDDAAAFQAGVSADPGDIDRLRWRATWFRDNASAFHS